MAKMTIATVPTTIANASKNSTELRMIGRLAPQMLAIPTVSENKYITRKINGKNEIITNTFAVLSSEKKGNFSRLVRFANITKPSDLALYQVYNEGASLERMTGKSAKAKANNQLIDDAEEAFDILMKQGFYSIINFTFAVQQTYGSGNGKTGNHFSDVYFPFATGSKAYANGKTYYNYDQATISKFILTTIKNSVKKINAQQVETFLSSHVQFLADNQEAINEIKANYITRTQITEAHKVEAEAQGTSVNYTALSEELKQIPSDLLTQVKLAEDAVNFLLQFPITTTAKGGCVRMF